MTSQEDPGIPGTAIEQRKAIWSGCQTVLGCGGIIALGAIAYYVIGLLPGSIVRGPGVIVFAWAQGLHDELFFIALFGGVFFLLMLASAGSNRALVLICITFAALTVFTVYHLWWRVTSLSVEKQTVHLYYLWPRPRQDLQAREVTAVDYEESVHAGADYGSLDYTLILRTRSRTFVSYDHGDWSDIQNARDAIEAGKRYSN